MIGPENEFDRRSFVARGAAAALAAAGVASAQEPAPPKPATTPPVRQDPGVRPGARGSLQREEDPRTALTEAVCVLLPTAGSAATGFVRFSRSERRQFTVRGELSGLPPGQKLALQVNEFGDLRAPNASATGGPYSPAATEGDADGAAGRPCDLAVVASDADGKALFELVLETITVNARRNPVLGRSIVVMRQGDASGTKLAQGVIGVANPAWKPS
ncbi:MAG: superoxide dismutase family protein [Planctomycetes bacterium]|nr:superoxide dismutase family protein [Planctomycetota bacterium]